MLIVQEYCPAVKVIFNEMSCFLCLDTVPEPESADLMIRCRHIWLSGTDASDDPALCAGVHKWYNALRIPGQGFRSAVSNAYENC